MSGQGQVKVKDSSNHDRSGQGLPDLVESRWGQGFVRSGHQKSGHVMSDKVKVRSNLIRSSQLWSCQVRSGLVRSKSWKGYVRTCQV